MLEVLRGRATVEKKVIGMPLFLKPTQIGFDLWPSNAVGDIMWGIDKPSNHVAKRNQTPIVLTEPGQELFLDECLERGILLAPAGPLVQFLSEAERSLTLFGHRVQPIIITHFRWRLLVQRQQLVFE
jgi:hypothetical protein